MNTVKQKPRSPLLNMLWPPALTLLVNHATFGVRYFTAASLFVGATAVALPFFFLLSQLQIMLSHKLRKKYPRFEQRKARFAAWIFVSLPLTLAFIAALWFAYGYLPLLRNSVHAGSLLLALLLGTVTHIISIIVNEGQFTYDQWKQAIVEAERLERINWESRYEGLKQQVNPHFLFNSINTLSSLIYEDKTEAGRYVKEMSRVYRYLLRNNDDELVPLHTELGFIQSYYHLLKTRFGTGIQLQLDVPERFATCLLPPLTLQMLVENAVKHNNLSKDAPLTIQITCTENSRLTVRNNLQKKQGHVDSMGIGLNNIREKYRLLGLPEVQLRTNDREFMVIIPLVEQHGKKVTEKA